MGQDRGGLIVAQLPGEWGHARTRRLKVSCNTTRAVLVILDANPVGDESRAISTLRQSRHSFASAKEDLPLLAEADFSALRLMWRRWAGAE